VGISRCTCRYTICVSIAQWSISQNGSTNMRSCKSWILFDAPLSDLQILTTPENIHSSNWRFSLMWGQLADGARWTVVRSYRLDVCSETELRIKAEELLFEDAYLSKVVNDKKSWFTRMEVLDLIYHQFFSTANSLGHQPITSQYFPPLAPQTLVLAAAAIHCALSQYASGKKPRVMFSQDEYWGTFGPSPVINFTLEATTQSITHQQPLHTPPPPVVQLH